MTERSCATCGTVFTVPANNPHRRFCSPRCRVADWHAHHDRRADPDQRPDVPNGVQPTNVVPDPNRVHRCPHCRHEFAVVTLVVPATAAHVRTPQIGAHDA